MTRLLRNLAWVLALAIGLVGLSAAPGSAQEELSVSLSRLAPVFGQMESYQRKGKEDIHRIARRFGVSASAVYNANVGDLTEGNELLLIPKEHIVPASTSDGVIVNLPERGLYIVEAGRPVRYFPVAIGMRGWETPTGEFTIANKRKNPTWFPPSWAVQEEPVPPGPGNPLGDRWMGLSARSYGIHATNAPSTVGHYVSHGCMRMYPEQARELFDLVKVGTPVTIVYHRVVVGYRPEEATVYLSYYPDPYQMGDVRPEDVRKGLEEYGLGDVADMDAVAKALERASGLPVAVIEPAARVLVNGAPVRFALGPVRVGSDWLVPAGPLVKALRGQIEMGAWRDYFVVKGGGKRMFFARGSADAIVDGRVVQLAAAPQLAAGYPMIPLKATVMMMGGSVGWDEGKHTISVRDGWGGVPLAEPIPQ